MKTIQNISITAGLLLSLSVPAYAQTFGYPTDPTPSPTYPPVGSYPTEHPYPANFVTPAPAQRDVRSLHGSQSPAPRPMPGHGRALFMEQIKQRLDAQHQQIALQVIDQLNTINKNRTDRMTTYLQRLTAILGKITVRTDALEKQGVNVTNIRTAITTAQTVIATAQTAITTQASKEYTADLSTTAPVGQAVRTVIQQLRTDLQTLRQTALQPAQQAVLAAFQALVAATPQPSGLPLPSTTPTNTSPLLNSTTTTPPL